MGWSYDLLDPEAQQVFRALSVFAGSFDLTAAAAVAGGDDLDEFAETSLAHSLAMAEAAGNRVWLTEALTCGCGPLLGQTYTDEYLDRVLDLYESHPGWEDTGRLYATVIAQNRGIALTRRSPAEAAMVAVAGVRLSDQSGFDFQFSGCLESLLLAVTLTGQIDAAAELRSYLLTAGLPGMAPRPTLWAGVEGILAAAGVDLDARDHGVANRRDLLDLLDEIEAALPD